MTMNQQKQQDSQALDPMTNDTSSLYVGMAILAVAGLSLTLQACGAGQSKVDVASLTIGTKSSFAAPSTKLPLPHAIASGGTSVSQANSSLLGKFLFRRTDCTAAGGTGTPFYRDTDVGFSDVIRIQEQQVIWTVEATVGAADCLITSTFDISSVNATEMTLRNRQIVVQKDGLVIDPAQDQSCNSGDIMPAAGEAGQISTYSYSVTPQALFLAYNGAVACKSPASDVDVFSRDTPSGI